jgi:hypothetical protein
MLLGSTRLPLCLLQEVFLFLGFESFQAKSVHSSWNQEVNSRFFRIIPVFSSRVKTTRIEAAGVRSFVSLEDGLLYLPMTLSDVLSVYDLDSMKKYHAIPMDPLSCYTFLYVFNQVVFWGKNNKNEITIFNIATQQRRVWILPFVIGSESLKGYESTLYILDVASATIHCYEFEGGHLAMKFVKKWKVSMKKPKGILVVKKDLVAVFQRCFEKYELSFWDNRGNVLYSYFIPSRDTDSIRAASGLIYVLDKLHVFSKSKPKEVQIRVYNETGNLLLRQRWPDVGCQQFNVTSNAIFFFCYDWRGTGQSVMQTYRRLLCV